MENALNVMKDQVSEFITEQENEDKLNNEIDILLDGKDFSKPMDCKSMPLVWCRLTLLILLVVRHSK